MAYFELVYFQPAAAHFVYARANPLRDGDFAKVSFNIGQTANIKANCRSAFFQLRKQCPG